jgi:hypothetical protein
MKRYKSLKEYDAPFISEQKNYGDATTAFSEDGDIKIAPNGDIALAESEWRDDAQQAYVRIKTEPGDYLLYKKILSPNSRLYKSDLV